MQIKVNGQASELPAGATILSLLDRHKLAPGQVAVELNRRLVRQADYGRELHEGDEVEIVTFVGGG